MDEQKAYLKHLLIRGLGLKVLDLSGGSFECTHANAVVIVLLVVVDSSREGEWIEAEMEVT